MKEKPRRECESVFSSAIKDVYSFLLQNNGRTRNNITQSADWMVDIASQSSNRMPIFSQFEISTARSS